MHPLFMLLIFADDDNRVVIQFAIDNIKYKCNLNRGLEKLDNDKYIMKWKDKNYDAKIWSG